MSDPRWSKAVEIIKPHVVRISTPTVSGTGFLISNGKKTDICGIATASHVVEHAHKWQEPITIDHVSSGKILVISHEARAVFPDPKRDTAGLIFERGDLPLPADPLSLAPKKRYIAVGTNIGWLGFPAMITANLCFFAGHVSAWIQEQLTYLVDGVAINGVSGGPAFCVEIAEGLQVMVIGVVTEYVPNRATEELLPGLSMVRDVTQFHELAPTFASLDQAKEAEKQSEPTGPVTDSKGSGSEPTRPRPTRGPNKD